MDSDSDSNKLHLEKRILNFSFAGSVAFLLAEVGFSLATGSKAILMDCIYDGAEVVMIGPFLVLIPFLYKPVTEEKPYGFSQVESLFVLIKYVLLLCIELGLVVNCIQVILSGGNSVKATTIAWFEIAISVGCILMYLLLSRLEKTCSSPSVKAEIFIWKLDSISTMGVGLAFIVCFILEHTSLSFITPYVDPVIAIAVAVILAKEPLTIILESIRSLLLFAPDEELFQKVDRICIERMEAIHCTVNFTDVIKTGRKLWIEVYFSKSGDMIDVGKLKSAYQDIKQKLTDEFEDIGLELIPDMEEGFRNVKPVPPVRRKDRISYIEKQEDRKANKKNKKQQL